MAEEHSLILRVISKVGEIFSLSCHLKRPSNLISLLRIASTRPLKINRDKLASYSSYFILFEPRSSIRVLQLVVG